MDKKLAFGIIIGFTFVCMLVLFCIILVRLYIRKITNYNKVIYQKDLDFQKNLNDAIIETQEQVLNNISRDLHDDAGQQLTYINFQVENLKLDSPENAKTLEPITQSVANLSRSIRNISHSLNNQLLLQQDLVKAISAEAERIKNTGRIDIHLDIPQDVSALGTNEKIVIYRIFQEVINNSLKHAKATAIDISVKSDPGFSMTVTDNGKGFNTEQQEHPTLGLSNIVARAAAINYNVNIRSAEGQGTSISISETPSYGKD